MASKNRQYDPFRPSNQPAQLIYDALIDESAKRKGRPVDEWVKAERNAVWTAARDYAQQLGVQVPTLALVEAKERLAMGHTDYAAKWALGISELILSQEKAAA